MQLKKGSLAGRVVLVVDNDPLSRDILRTFLRDLGATVLEAVDHTECFPVIDTRELHAVIIEPYWPGMDPADFVDRVCNACKPHVRIIITTTDAGLTEKENLAVHEVFLKPYHVAQVAVALIS